MTGLKGDLHWRQGRIFTYSTMCQNFSHWLCPRWPTSHEWLTWLCPGLFDLSPVTFWGTISFTCSSCGQLTSFLVQTRNISHLISHVIEDGEGIDLIFRGSCLQPQKKPHMAFCSHWLPSEMCMQHIHSIVTANLTDRRQCMSSAFPIWSFFCKFQALLTSSSKAARILPKSYLYIKHNTCSRQAVVHGLWIHTALAFHTENNRG